MAGPTITVAILGDEKDFVKATEHVSDAADEMTRKVGRSSDELGGKVDELDGKASAAERGFRGFSDSLNGTSDVMGGLQSGNLVQLGMGMADLFGAVQDLFLPLLQQMAVKLGLVTVATEGQTAAQEASNVAMAANPIGLVVIALAALAVAFYVAWTKSETFRDIVTGAFNTVRDVVAGVADFIGEHWRIMVDAITLGQAELVIQIARHWNDIRGFITTAINLVNQVVGPILDGIRGGFDFVRDGVQFVIDKLHEIVEYVKGPFSAIAGVVKDVIGGIASVVPGGKARPLEFTDAQVAATAAIVGNGTFNGTPNLGANTTIYYPAGYNQRAVADAQRKYTRLNPAPNFG